MRLEKVKTRFFADHPKHHWPGDTIFEFVSIERFRNDLKRWLNQPRDTVIVVCRHNWPVGFLTLIGLPSPVLTI